MLLFKNSPKYPNDAQMFNCKIDKWILPQHSNAKWSCHMIFGWSKFIKSLHLPGLNFQNSCWHMKIDRINRCFADFSSSYPLVNCWAFKWKKKKENDFQKIFKASFKLIFFLSPIVPIPSYISLDKDQQLSVLEFDGCYDSCSTATSISVGRIFTTLSIFDILCRCGNPFIF